MQRLADLDLIALIGEGATSEVWRARRRGGLGHVVAVKRLRVTTTAEERARFRAEAAVLQDLDHPHIVRVLDVVADGEHVAIVMAYAPGGTLADLLAERGTLTPGEAVAVLAPLADALASTHRRGVVHGDVKPANVLLTSDGEPLLADFGANRLQGGRELTPEYAAPEVLAGEEPMAESDVRALCAVGAELLTGRTPVAGRALEGPVGAALERGMADDPAARPDAAALASHLRAAVAPQEQRLPGPATTSTGAAPATRSFGPTPSGRDLVPVRTVWPWVLALAAVVAVAAAWFLASNSRNRSCPDLHVDQQPGAQVATGDFDGDGCDTAVTFTPDGAGDRGVLRIDLGGDAGPPFEVTVGGPGDRLHVGDWDCDGVDRPALHRPADATVVYVDELEVGAAVAAEPLGEPGQDVRVVTDADGCDSLEPR